MSTVPETKDTFTHGHRQGHNVTQYENRIKRTDADLGEYPELNSKVRQ